MSVLLQYMLNAISVGCIAALIALGIALVFGILGLINFAYGEMIMVGGYTMVLLGNMGMPWPITILTVLGVVTMLSLALERVAFRPVRGANASTLLVTSFAVSFFLQAIALLTLGALARPVLTPSFTTESIGIGGVTIAKIDVITIVVTIFLVAGLALFLRKARLGLEIRACAEDFEMVRLLGVRGNRVIESAFVISGLLAGVVAFLLIAKTGIVFPTMGLPIALIGFVGVVIGGLDSLTGAAAGGFVLGCLVTALQIMLPDSVAPFRDAFVYGAVILVLLFRPQGLFGGPASRLEV